MTPLSLLSLFACLALFLLLRYRAYRHYLINRLQGRPQAEPWCPVSIRLHIIQDFDKRLAGDRWNTLKKELL